MSLLWTAAKAYYHASPEEFEPGDRLEPGGAERQTYLRPPGRPGDRVYLSKEPSTAEMWAERIADVTGRTTHVYKVTAPESTRHWCKDVDDYELRAPHAHVVERTSSHEPGGW